MLPILLAAAPWLVAPAAAVATSTDSIVAPPPGTARDTVVVLPEVRVERARLAEARRRAPTAFVTEVHTGESGRALETLTELLSEIAGVHLQQYGGLGAFSTMSLRGAPPGHVAIYLDGVPLTSAAHGVVSLGDLPATAIERIEVYRGSAPLALGVPGAAGAVNLVTLRTPELRELRLTHGSFGTWETRATAAAHRDAWSGLLHLGYQGSRGDFLYPDDNGTPFNVADDSISMRLNNRFEALAGVAHLAWRPRSGLTLALREDLFDKRQGLPGLGAVPARDTRLAFLRSLTHFELVAAEGRYRPAARMRASVQRERSRLRDPEAELGLGYHDTDDRVGGEGVDVELDSPRIPAGIVLRAAGSLGREHARLHDAADGWPDPAPSRRDRLGGMLGLEMRPAGERLVLHAAQRWDRLHDRLRSTAVGGVERATDVTRRLVTPQLGASVAAAPGLVLRANWTRAGRAPDFLELFGNQGSVRGNADLHPESSESWDAGGSWSSPERLAVRAEVEAAHFQSRARDLVLYVRAQAGVRAVNVAQARVRGQELSLRARGPLGLSLAASLTRQQARDESAVSYWYGKRLPQRPEHEAHARLDWKRGALRAGVDLHAIGDNILDRYNLQRVPRRTLLGASLCFVPFTRGPQLTVEGKNLGDDRVSDVGGFPLPGRSVFASCEVRLGPAVSARP
jgi:outer membrane cobalamin receptor